jgi:hypothetical protein
VLVRVHFRVVRPYLCRGRVSGGGYVRKGWAEEREGGRERTEGGRGDSPIWATWVARDGGRV